ncbi:transcription-repair coupling factor [Capnocytophaga sp. oral taxon 338]|uniref:transcription-repair coupling factor n=1 Tax=Capnocytophaga sp. oral taxon 338 TaxID=710239 RepID=UPI000202E4AB|nr:transcription-repair coupling factor [Capnocytophaga sp. oral taxon 338]EGD34830.1 transcription-repair coupling factor [Capnocytophaga sp. oral taxon 338 str. F0234]
MSKELLLTSFWEGESYKQLSQHIKGKIPCYMEGIVGSAISFVLSEIFKQTKQTLFFVGDDKEQAAYLLNDLELLLGQDQVLFFPSSYRRPYQTEETDNANVLLRAEVLSHIQKEAKVVVSYSEALFEKVLTRQQLEKNTLTLKVGEQLSLDTLNEVLFEYQFNRVDFVSEPGEFSVRGGIVDVFSFSNDTPYRIEFFSDVIESIRSFDVETQLSIQQVPSVVIIPNIENKLAGEQRTSFLSLLPENTLIFTQDFELFVPKWEKMYQKAQETFATLNNTIAHLPPQELFSEATELLKEFERRYVIKINPHFPQEEKGEKVFFAMRTQPSFNKRFELLIQHFKEKYNEGYSNYICCVSVQQAQRFLDIFEELHEQVPCELIEFPLAMGFTDTLDKINCYTDHQILERYHKFNIRNGYAKKQAITLKELHQLTIGDYVTHIDHGIGKFAGLQKIEVDGRQQEAIKLIYGDRDVLYVSIHSLHKISKYNGKDGAPPKLYKLGSSAWKTLKQRTKARVKQIAFNLIQLYAKRKESVGYAFAPDSFLQKELEASFIYEDTPDQSKATLEVKQDMESARPMDRLVCGDVGFGKTEVAIRAAFKAVDNSKQVAVLVPTTILAFQHYQTFCDRLKGLPVRVEYLNRFRTAKEKNQVLTDLALGKIDILIGTHQIVNEKVKYKDLGLLIIDEEQKFGVAVKDKLKTLRENIDVLTLTATPIPRTLQFSLMAARDLSVITTPPPNRYPIESQVITFSEEAIRDAISYELQRGGQVFFIHNRVENIKEVAGMIQRLVPDARIGIGHGQMEGKALEEVMLAFINGDYDILVATTIIESGLDVPNANTIFIHNAQHFGLSDLHQMRGRVGRSNKKAFCYFITPNLSELPEDSRKRIQAIAQFSDLGSGIQIAMKDLEIRGAGDLLGGEQSGFINDIGFDAYQKILQEAVMELKENEFASLYTDTSQTEVFLTDTQLDSDFELLYPDNYINSITERLNLYNELSNLKSEEELTRYENRLIDRFGPLPQQAKDLLNSVRIKWVATRMGIERLVMKQGKMLGYFIADQQSKFYQSDIFQKVLSFVQLNSDKCHLNEKETRNGLRLIITFDKITSIDKALRILNSF